MGSATSGADARPAALRSILHRITADYAVFLSYLDGGPSPSVYQWIASRGFDMAAALYREGYPVEGHRLIAGYLERVGAWDVMTKIGGQTTPLRRADMQFVVEVTQLIRDIHSNSLYNYLDRLAPSDRIWIMDQIIPAVRSLAPLQRPVRLVYSNMSGMAYWSFRKNRARIAERAPTTIQQGYLRATARLEATIKGGLAHLGPNMIRYIWTSI